MHSRDLTPACWWSACLLASLLLLEVPAAAGQSCSWLPAAPLEQPRMEAHALVVGGRLLQFGGFEDPQYRASARLDAYDPGSNTWTRLADAPLRLTHAGFAEDGDTLWVVGGFVGPNPGWVTAQVHTYSLAGGTWTARPPLPAPRGSGATVRLGRSLHFFGGVLPDRNTDSLDHWVLDLDAPAAGWSPRASMPEPRNHLAGIELAGRILAVGGQFRHDISPQDVPFVHSYDPASNQWTALPPLPFGRSHFEASLCEIQGQLLITGGRARGLGLEELADVTLYDPTTGSVTALVPLPQPLLGPTAKLLGTRLHVVGGGALAVPLATHHVRVLSLEPYQAARINAGGNPWTSSTGVQWCGDFGFLGGQNFASAPGAAIANTVDDALYLSERTGSSPAPQTLGYRLPADPGLYRVRLHFAEIFWGAPGGGAGGPGQRVFDVFLEDVKVMDDYDIHARVGAMAADVHTFDLAAAGGAIDLHMAASQDRPKISAIEVLALAPGSFGPTCQGAVNSTGAAAVLGLIGSTSISHDALRLACSGAPPGQVAVFAMSPQQGSIPFGNGTLCLAPPLQRIGAPGVVDAGGDVERALSWSQPGHAAAAIQAGSTWHFQVFYRDPLAGADNLSGGLRIQFLP